jgi:hypothetical protein
MIRTNLIKSIKNNKSCTVIGNGPYITDLSKYINGSYVMRCNNFKLISPEIGTRTDLKMSSLYNGDNEKYSFPILGVLPISDTLYQQYTEAKKQHLIWLNNSKKLIEAGNLVWIYNESDSYSEVFKSVAGKINAFPSTGLMGIATARWMGFTQIILSGFTFFQTKLNKPMGSHHNATTELALVNEWVCTDDIHYILDELTEYELTKYDVHL